MNAALARKSLFYESKVEYARWAANHAHGCRHGCRYCYAYSLNRRFGRTPSVAEWQTPTLVPNALELAEKEIPSLVRKGVSTVHLSFMTDPWMYDADAGRPWDEMSLLTLGIIERLNAVGIAVTTLTKGVHPEALYEALPYLSRYNSYGVTVTSMNREYTTEWEPNAAPVEDRLTSLDRLAYAGCITWASIEPYPTPNIDASAGDPTPILQELESVAAIVFGRMNYVPEVTQYVKSDPGYYERAASTTIEWCEANDKALWVKDKTPHAGDYGWGLK